MHPAIFIGAAVSLGCLFALQEWISSRFWNYQIHLGLLLQAWGVQYFIWGVICWVIWWKLSPQINNATLRTMLTFFLPLSIAVGVFEEMIWILIFPTLPHGRPPMPYWRRLAFVLDGEMIDNIVLFWCAFFLFRGLGYYQRFRERESRIPAAITACSGADAGTTDAAQSALSFQYDERHLQPHAERRSGGRSNAGTT